MYSFVEICCLTQGSNPQVETGSGHFSSVYVSPSDGSKADYWSGLRVNIVVSLSQTFGGARILGLVLGYAGTIVQKDANVDAHDGNDASHVEIHHEDALIRGFHTMRIRCLIDGY